MNRVRVRRRAFFTFDAMIALIVLVALMVVIAVAGSWQQRAAHRSADARQAARAADRAMLELHAGRPITPDPDVRLQVESASAAGQEVSGYRWVRVVGECNGRVVSLVGLARGDATTKPTEAVDENH
jgi:hypothetical protein